MRWRVAMQGFAAVATVRYREGMRPSEPQDLIHRVEQLLADSRALHAEHCRVHYERVRQFERAKELHFTEPMFSHGSPTLPGVK